MDFFCERGDTDEVVGLFAEVLTEPLLPEDRLELTKAQVYNQVGYEAAGAAAAGPPSRPGFEARPALAD